MTETLDSQIDRLAQHILENVPGEPSQNEGAVDTAIRLLQQGSLVPHVAVSLYQYNVSGVERAMRLHNHFHGDCAELTELRQMADSKNWATEMPYPTAVVYLAHAMERYAKEAAHRVRINSDHC